MRPVHGASVLALVTDAYGGTGGIAQYNRDLLQAIARHPSIGEVTVLPRLIARKAEPVPEKIRHVSSAAGSKSRFVGVALRAALARPKPDMVLCGHINLLPVARAVATATGAPLVITIYGAEVWEARGARWRRLVESATAVISISEFTLGRMRAWADIPEPRAFLLPNAVDLTRYLPGPPNSVLRARLGITDRPVLLTLGRMEESERGKGFDEVLEALPELATEFPGLQYCAAGDGNDRERLAQKAVALGVRDRVRFPGYISESDKPDLYRLADAFVMPSTLEGFGYVFLEALASGIPVVASRIDGSSEAVRHGLLGIMVDPRDKRDVVSGIRSVILNPQVPPREELEYFSPSRFESRCHEMLDAILANARGKPAPV